MSRSDRQKAYNIPLRRLPSIRSGVTLIWLEDPNLSSSNESVEAIARLRALKNYYVLHYTALSKCIKYLKRARSYERAIIIIGISDDHNDLKETSISVTDVSRLCSYRQVQSIFIVSSTVKEINSDTENNSATNVRKDMEKVIGIFRNHRSMFIQLQNLISETEECDDGLFSAFNLREKALRDVRHELGAFVWSHSYRGEYNFLII